MILNPWVSPMAIIVTPFQGENENNNPEKFRGDASFIIKPVDVEMLSEILC